ncbi:MAG: MOSC domain-containing protein [Gammaproteobacteria bacterium]|nr:MOSC domain-containing protein [Gammaproteobacteria bacterium]
MITLSELAIYPIKSTAQISLTKSLIGPFGLDMDRRWMLIDEAGLMLTQRKHPRMCLIKSSLNNAQLTVSAEGMQSLNIMTPDPQKLIKATVWEDTCRAYDMGNSVAEWFSTFLKTPARLVYFPADEIRQVDLDYARKGDITAFSDAFPYLLISQASLDDLNSRLNSAVEMKRFRPNLVVTGNQAFAEDNWKQIRIGGIVFNLVKPCSRCVIPSINPDTAEKTAEILKTLAAYRMRENKICFGQNLLADGTGELKVGMEVEVISTY